MEPLDFFYLREAIEVFPGVSGFRENSGVLGSLVVCRLDWGFASTCCPPRLPGQRVALLVLFGHPWIALTMPKRVAAPGLTSADMVSTSGSAVIAAEIKPLVFPIPSSEFVSQAACVSILNNEVE